MGGEAPGGWEDEGREGEFQGFALRKGQESG